MKKISLVVALKNEEANISPLLDAVSGAMQSFDYELILVDDGSTDDTVATVKKRATPQTRLLIFSKNYGQTQALSAGIAAATGDYIITLDGDLQNDPTDIPAMLEKLEAGEWDLVAGRRAGRKDGFVLRKLPSYIANRMIQRLTGVYIQDYGCTLKVFRKEIAQNLGMYGELHRFIPVLAHMQGARITEMDVKHHARIHGQSKYGIGRTFKVMSDLLLMLFFQKYAPKPMHLFGTAGIVSFLMGAGINVYLLIEKLLGNDIGGRPLLVLGLILVLGGIQLISLGFITELQMRTYFESQGKKPYQIKEIFIGEQSTH